MPRHHFIGQTNNTACPGGEILIDGSCVQNPDECLLGGISSPGKYLFEGKGKTVYLIMCRSMAMGD
jgi:hypothetical protein